ncbi:MAG: tetratricopeptide repeat protein, partial [Ktedonobacteraceae bacterium]
MRSKQWLNEEATLDGLGRYEEALAVCEQAMHLDPNNAITYLNKGNALKYLSRYEEALASYERAITLDADNATIHLNKAQ